MSLVDSVLHRLREYLIKFVVTSYTRVYYEPADFNIDLKISENKWTVEVTAVGDYGELAMKKAFERFTTEELNKG